MYYYKYNNWMERRVQEEKIFYYAKKKYKIIPATGNPDKGKKKRKNILLDLYTLRITLRIQNSFFRVVYNIPKLKTSTYIYIRINNRNFIHKCFRFFLLLLLLLLFRLSEPPLLSSFLLLTTVRIAFLLE